MSKQIKKIRKKQYEEIMVRNYQEGMCMPSSGKASLRDMNFQTRHMQVAIENDNIRFLKLIVNDGADILQEMPFGMPFHYAASSGSIGIINYLLKNGVNIDDKDGNGNTALHAVCIELKSPVHSKSCRHLLKRRANINARNNENKTPLFYALQRLHTSINAVHGFKTWDSQSIDSYKTSLAQLLSKLDIIHDFLKHGVNLDDVLKGCPNILHAAVAAGDEKLMEYFLQQNIKVDRRKNQDATPLHCAAFFGRVELMATLIHHGANINATMNKKLTPLHLATLQGQVAFAIALMNFGADIDAQDDWGRTALHNAALFENKAIVWALLLRGADTGIKDKQGYDSLDELNQLNKTYMTRILIETTALFSKAFSEFRIGFIGCLYSIEKNSQCNHDPQELVDRRETWRIFINKSLSLKESKDKMLQMNKEELIEISKAKTLDSVLAQEVIVMRNTALCDNVTLYDLLTKDINKIASYLVDTEIPDFTAFSRNGFYWLLQKRMNAVRRQNLFGWAAKELGQRLQIRLPQEVMDEVVTNLDEQDVRNILRATFGYEGEDIFDDEKKIQDAKQEFETTFQSSHPKRLLFQS